MKQLMRITGAAFISLATIYVMIAAITIAHITTTSASYQSLELEKPISDSKKNLAWHQACIQQPALAGWLSVDQTPIAYPVVQASTESKLSYFLNHTVWGEPSLYGSVVLDPLGQQTLHTIAYGHRTEFNNTMFGSLVSMCQQKTFDTIGNLLWYVPYKRRVPGSSGPPTGIYSPFCAFEVSASDAPVRQFPTSSDDLHIFAQDLLQRASAVNPVTERSISCISRLFSLVTCTTLAQNSEQRTVVVFAEMKHKSSNLKLKHQA